MVLVDTSVWIAHFRAQQLPLMDLLRDGQVLGHPFVIGELACGNLRKRESILGDFSALPPAVCAGDAEVMWLLESRRLWGRGLGWVDAHLLASALITDCRLWTLDKRLGEAARELRLT